MTVMHDSAAAACGGTAVARIRLSVMIVATSLALVSMADADTTHLTATVGTSGGTISGNAGSIEAQTSTGDAIQGGVTTTGTIQDKGGYTGQLHDPIALQLTSTPTTTIDEGSTRQLESILLLDDDTTLATSSAWSIVGGPLANIDANGLATAGLVYQDSPATASAASSGLTGFIGLTVLDTDPDNFGTYSSDGIDDDWQVLFFGLDNPDATPTADPDADDQNNLYEFLAKVDPTDSASFFSACLERNPVDPSRRDIVLIPVFPDRIYTLLASPDLVPANFIPVIDPTATNNGNQRTITDAAAVNRRFYKIQITK
jgi:hypothetical protein